MILIFLKAASKFFSEVIIVRNSDSEKMSAIILLCLSLGVYNFPKTTTVMVALYGWYAWNVYKLWCIDFKERFPRENKSSPSNKDVPPPHHEGHNKSGGDSINRGGGRTLRQMGRRLRKVSHSKCQCIGKSIALLVWHPLYLMILIPYRR